MKPYCRVAESSALLLATLENPAKFLQRVDLILGMLTLAFVSDQAVPPATGQKVNEWRDDEGIVFARGYSSEGSQWIDWPGLGVFGFKAGSPEVRVWPQSGARREAIVETFFRTLQPLILQVLGWQALHAAAVVWHTGVLAFCGSKGSGKSTLAFARHQAGWQQFADDAVVLRLDDDRVIACGLPFTPRLRHASCAYFGNNAHLSPIQKKQPADIPLIAIFVLKQDIGLMHPRVSLIPKARAFLELLAHAHCFDVNDTMKKRRLVEDYLCIAARVPIFTLAYQPNFQHLPRLTRAVLEAATTIHPRGRWPI